MYLNFTRCRIQINYDTVYDLQHQADFHIGIKLKSAEKS